MATSVQLSDRTSSHCRHATQLTQGRAKHPIAVLEPKRAARTPGFLTRTHTSPVHRVEKTIQPSFKLVSRTQRTTIVLKNKKRGLTSNSRRRSQSQASAARVRLNISSHAAQHRVPSPANRSHVSAKTSAVCSTRPLPTFRNPVVKLK